MANAPDSPQQPTTEVGWDRNERDRLAIGVDATPAQRLAWLEEAIRIAYRTGALPKPADRDPPSGS